MVVVVVVVIDMVAEGTMKGGIDHHGKWRSPGTPNEQTAGVLETWDPASGSWILEPGSWIISFFPGMC